MPQYPRPKRILTKEGTEENEVPYLPELSPVTDRSGLLMTRAWLDWCRRVTGFMQHGGGPPGTVTGPDSATADNLASYSGTTGKVLKDSGIPTAQVARRDQQNTYTLYQRFHGAAETYYFLQLIEPTNGADLKAWALASDSGGENTCSLRPLTDAGTGTGIGFRFFRAGHVAVPGDLTVGQSTTVVGGNVARRDVTNTFTADRQTFEASAPALHLKDTSQPADARMFQIADAVQSLYFNALADNGTTVQATPLRLDRSGNAFFGAGIFEKGRGTAVGHWQDVPWNPTDYQGTGGMTWTVSSINTHRYALIGNTLHWNLLLDGSTLGGTASNTITIRIPGGFTAHVANWGLLCRLLIGGVVVLGSCTTAAGLTLLNVQRNDGANFALGGLFVLLSITIEIR